MTYYHNEIIRIQRECYANQTQLDTVIGVRNFINDRYHTTINLEVLSRARFTSKFHLLRLFRRYYGQTPKQYLTEKRLEHAKRLLATGRSASDTCYEVGFENPSAFSTLFKSRFGISPAAFQKKAIFTK